MLPAMGPMMLLATLEDTIQQLLKEKLALQTELELLKAGVSTPTSHCGSHQQQHPQQQGDAATADALLGNDSSTYSSGTTAIGIFEPGRAPICSAASFLELQQLVQQLQHENAAVKASLTELLQADDQELARLHALLADKALTGVLGATQDGLLDGTLPRQHDFDDGVAAARAAAAAGTEAEGLQLFDLRGVDNTKNGLLHNAAAAAAAAAMLGDPAATDGATTALEHHLAIGNGQAQQQQSLNTTQSPPELVPVSVDPATHQSSRSSRQRMLAFIHQQQMLLTQLQRLCSQQQQGSGSNLFPESSDSHQLLLQAQQEAAALSCTLTDIRHQIVTSLGSALPDAAAISAVTAAAAAAAGGGSSNRDRLELTVVQSQQQQQQQELPTGEQQLAAARLQLEDTPALLLKQISATAAAAAGPSSIDAAAAAAAAGGDLATATQVDTIDLRDLQQQGQQQQQAVADLDSDELDALLADADQQQLLPAPLKLDSAGNLVSPTAAANAAEAIAAVQQQQRTSSSGSLQQQQHCCALCGEQFPCAAAFWVHCVMPHHVLLLLIRQQQLQGTGLLGLEALPGWSRRSLQLLPQITAAAAAAGGGSRSRGATTNTSHSSSKKRTQQQVSGDAALSCAAAAGAYAAAGLSCCDEQMTTELQMVKHYLSSSHIDRVTKAVTAAADQAGSSSGNGSRFTPDCCEHIRQLASALIAVWTAADGVVKTLQALTRPSLPTAAADQAAGRSKTKHAPAAATRAQQQQQQDRLSQESAHALLLLLLESYTAAVESYSTGFGGLEAAGLLPVPVPQGAAQALDLLFHCYKQQVPSDVTCRVTVLQLPAQMPEPGPAMRVWMNPGVYVLPVELLLRLQHQPAAAAAASVMLGVEQEQENQEGAQQQHKQQSQQHQTASKGSQLLQQQQQQSQQKDPLAQQNNKPRKVTATAAAKKDRSGVAAIADQAGVAAEGSKQSSKRPKRPLHQPPAATADPGGAISDPAVVIASGGDGGAAAAAAAAAADEKAPKRRKHEPIPRPPSIQARPAAAAPPAAAAGATGGNGGPSPSAVATAAAGSDGGVSARGNNLGSGFVQRGNKITTAATRSTLPSSHNRQQQQQLQGLGGSRALLQGPASMTADGLNTGAALPASVLSRAALARTVAGSGGHSGQQLAAASGGMLSGGFRASSPAVVGFDRTVAPGASGGGFAHALVQQYGDLYEEQARIEDLDFYGPGLSPIFPMGGFSSPGSFWEGDYFVDSGMEVQQQNGQGSRGGLGPELRGRLHPGRGDGMAGLQGHRGRGGW